MCAPERKERWIPSPTSCPGILRKRPRKRDCWDCFVRCDKDGPRPPGRRPLLSFQGSRPKAQGPKRLSFPGSRSPSPVGLRESPTYLLPVPCPSAPTSKDLRSSYNQYNREYLGGHLPCNARGTGD
jgi:hypothetical protein